MKRIKFHGMICAGAALAEWLVFLLCRNVLTLSLLKSTTAGFSLAALLYFVVRRLLYRPKSDAPILARGDVLPVLVVCYVGLLINLLCMPLFVNRLQILPLPAKILSTGAAFLWCFASNKLWINGRLARLDNEKRLSEILAALLTLLTFTLGMGMLHNGHIWGGDFSEYIAQGIAIAEGTVDRQVANNTWIVSHTYVGLGPTAYPWGLPLLLSGLYKLFGFNLFAFKIVGLLSATLLTPVVFSYFRKRFSVGTTFLLTGLFAVHLQILNRVNSIISDVPFLVVSMIALLCAENLLKADQKRRAYLWGALTGIAFSWGYMVRTNGLIWPVALLCVQMLAVFRKSRGFLGRVGSLSSEYDCRFVFAQILPYLLFIAVCVVTNRYLPRGDGSYMDMFSQLSLSSAMKTVKYFTGISRIEKIANPVIRIALSGGSVCLVGWIVALIIRNIKKETLSVVYLIGNLMMLLVWPNANELRFLYPVTPLLACLSVLLIKELRERFCPVRFKRAFSVLGTACLALCVAVSLMQTARVCVGNLKADRVFDQDAFAATSRDMYDFVTESTPENARVVSFKPRVFYLMTGRIGYDARRYNGETLSDADYLIVKNSEKRIDDELTAGTNPGVRLIQIYGNKDLTLYRIERNGAAPG